MQVLLLIDVLRAAVNSQPARRMNYESLYAEVSNNAPRSPKLTYNRMLFAVKRLMNAKILNIVPIANKIARFAATPSNR